MHYLSIISVATLGLAATVAADSLTVRQVCYFSGCGGQGTFQTTAGLYIVPGSDGCHRNPGPPGMTELCIDFGRERGHFKFNHQSFKRCLRLVRFEPYDCGVNTCWINYFDETPCTWREAAPSLGEKAEDLASVSVTEITAATPSADPEESLSDNVEEEE